ncbi:aminoglycoside phosphotransferase family protein [Legionella pneumophila serogroup 1]|uniref:aminoglycoside phosphotransferase family protein n=1 Tax=Legionella pneumophila TaxID=446 RepID=UPI000485572F|nr:aminoglycoside phosphotransferase family protein [Legionella pneumophila]MCZ4683869.1 aminoglycoside phosphotransferase family protein [Legionella pneumophila]VEB33257.1 aminoglycoside phosphotransferase [Legionella pneumophila]BCZ96330.1 aminoglycoside phosphotransferase [Legionella pneumophila]HAT1940903.1 aminoglycoside phosphotransferase family protein [Legionella pneumophila]HAT3861811.1 aminoglycoside phosphotransferase family protein [Legionella pneumophila]
MQPFIIDEKLVCRLIASQFPHYSNLPVKPVAVGGWDNRTFHLGKDMLVRLPSAEQYELQVEKEQQWLPQLASLLPVPIPTPLAKGMPGEGYPWKWSIYRWLEGETIVSANLSNLNEIAKDLATFLTAFHQIDSSGGPKPGMHSFYRGGDLKIYDPETRQAIDYLKGKIDTDHATEIWETALNTSWQGTPVWVHGDISAGNLLVKNGKLCAVIDFGQLSVGDPACDLAITWTLFAGDSRKIFREMLALDKGTWFRGQAWALWKALIVAAGIVNTNAMEVQKSCRIINELFLTKL